MDKNILSQEYKVIIRLFYVLEAINLFKLWPQTMQIAFSFLSVVYLIKLMEQSQWSSSRAELPCLSVLIFKMECGKTWVIPVI